ncbi:MAG: HD domain-containing protein, partial [Firmicutes bacterium]|nr:HD domain-containing protein [Bacillota bacterium]
MKSFRDPVHNLIAFSDRDQLIVDLINTREVQRLRRIRQLGLSHIAYPGAEHSRFVHSLGVAHLMRRFLDSDAGREGEFGAELAEYRQLAIASALLHDVGHGAFSHALETVTGVRHERFTTAIVRAQSTEVHAVLERHEPGLAEKVAQVVERRFQPSRAIVKLLSSQLDLDRTDYLLRDALMTGAGYGTFDVEWMLHVLRLGEVDGELEVGLDLEKGQSIAEDYIMCRYYMYLHVYFHHTTRAAEVMMETLLRRAQHSEARLPGFTALNRLLDGALGADEEGVQA